MADVTSAAGAQDRRARVAVTAVLTALVLALGGWVSAMPSAAHDEEPESGSGGLSVTRRLSDLPCRDGMAGPFPCHGMDLLGFVPLGEFDDVYTDPYVEPIASDLWGWVDPETGDEHVLVGKTSAVAMFRVSDPTGPVYLGDLLNPSPSQFQAMDIKVHADHAFVVSESEAFGLQIFDLTRLRGIEAAQTWTEDAHYEGVLSSHNLAINETTGYAYIVGGNAAGLAPDQCSSGLHFVDISDPSVPVFAGCWTGDSYIHDVQCVVYHGPDVAYRSRELCFTSSLDHVSIVDVTDKSSPRRVGSLTYPDAEYTHQGWLTEDHRHFVFGDEFDEREHETPTRTLIADVTDIDRPRLAGEHVGATTSTDHNLFVHDGLVHQSNYTAGYRVLGTDAIADGRLQEIAYLDTYPADDEVGWHAGSWGNYPFLPSGTVAVTSKEEGLFLVRPSGVPVRRLAGADRIATAAAVSAATFPASPDTVVIASGSNYPDALAGAPLAGSLDAPVLLSGRDGLADTTTAEIRRLGATRAFLLGGTALLSEQIERDLSRLGVEEVIRLAGADRFETAGLVADVLMDAERIDTVYLVEGADEDPSRGWPDAVSVSSLAATQSNPILLVTTIQLPEATENRLRVLREVGIDRAVVVGGSAAVSTSVEEQVRALGFHVERLAGVDRFATSDAVANAARDTGADPGRTWLATGSNFPDALAAGPAAARSGGILHLISSNDIDPSTATWIEEHACQMRTLTLVGGPTAIAFTVERDLRDLLENTNCSTG